jgi:two-component system sporulation sensor kinase A
MSFNPSLPSTNQFFLMSPDLAALVHFEGHFLQLNPAWEKQLGFSVEELVGQPFLNLVPISDRPRAVNEIEKLSKPEGKIISFETACEAKNHSLRWISWTWTINIEEQRFYLSGRDLTDLRKVEKDLNESREKFLRLSDLSAEGIAIHEKGIILEANQALAKMFGYERVEEMVGQNGLDLTDPEGREKIRTHILANSEEVYEVTGLRKDGSSFPCQLRGRALIYQGRPVRISTFLDLSPLKKQEQDLFESEQKFRRLVEASTEGIVVTQQGKVIDANPALARMFGWEVSEIIGRSAVEFAAPESRDLVGKMVLSDLEQPYEAVGIRKNGSTFRVEISGRLFSYQRYAVRVGILKIIPDPPTAKPNPAKLKGDDDNFRKVFEGASIGMVLADLSQKSFRHILQVNQAFCEMLGYTEDEMVGKAIDEFWYPENFNPPQKNLELLIKNETKSHDSEKRYLKKNGEILWAHVTLTVIRGEETQPLYALAMIQNITDQKKAEQALKNSEARLKSIFNSGSQSAGVLDISGRLEAFNQSAALEVKRMLGKDLEVGRLFTDYLEPPLVWYFQERFQKALAGETLRSERMVPALDGQAHWFEIQYYPIFNEEREVTGICLTVVNIDDRKRSEESLRESEERFRRIFEDTSVGMTVVDRSYRFTYVNRAFCDFLGYTTEELQRMTFLDITHPEDQHTPFLTESSPGMEREKSGQIEKRLLHKEGEVLWANMTFTTIQDSQGRMMHGLGIVENITERKKAEATVRESEERYRRLVEFSPEGIFVYVKEKIVYANPAGLKLLGAARPEQLVGRPVLSIVHPEDQEKIKIRIDHVSMSGRVNPPLEQRFVRLDGQMVDVEAQGTYFTYMGRPAGLVIVRDITERKKARGAFRESQESYRRLVEFFPETVLVHSEGKIIYINAPGLQMFGATDSSQILGRSVYDFVSPEFVETARNRVETINLNKLSSDPMEQVWLRLDQSPIDIEVRGTFFSFMGKPAVLSILRNVSERKRTQQMLLRYERLAAIGQVIAGIAHDIRNPLAVLSSMTQQLSDRFAGQDSYAREMETITAQTERLKRLMNDILDYSRGLTLNKKWIYPQSLLEQCLRLVQTQIGAEHQRVEVKWNLPEGLEKFLADRERLEQVFLNLMLNAYEAVGSGGVIIFSCESTPDSIFLKVQDNGPGIPEGDMARLFEPFFTTKKHGSGLGLSVSQKIVEAHGGKIEVEWVYPHGTLFTVRIPRKLL